MNIQNFEQNVNQMIVPRGLEYFQEKRVEHPMIYPKLVFRQKLQGVKIE